jgi:2-methylcitrate dehydratase PrpD
VTAMSQQELTAGLARYVCDLQFADLPADVVAMAKDVFLDAIGGQLACSTLPHCRMAIEYARQQAGPADATVLGTELRTSVEHAALVNGIMGHGDEIDEVLELFGHTSAVLVPAVLAVGEREHSSGEDLIVALVAGYDVASRLSIAGFSLDKLGPRNFQQASTAGSVASAAAAGKLLRLDQLAMQAAFGLAAEQACGLQAMRMEDGHMNKSLHMGVGSRNGVASAYLARCGYGGIFDVLDPPYSMFEAFIPGAGRPDELLDGLGARFDILLTAIKYYSAGHPMHCAISGLLTIMDTHGLTVDDIASVDLQMETLIKKMLSHSPTLNVNIEYVVTVAALERDVRWEHYTEEYRQRPQVREFLGRVTSRGNPELDELKQANRGARPAIVTVTTTDARTFTEQVLYPPGHPRNPVDRSRVRAKFRRWATMVISEDQANSLVSTVDALEDLRDINDLRDLLVPVTVAAI